MNVSNASFTNVSFTTIASGTTRITNTGINTSLINDANVFIDTIRINTIFGQYASGERGQFNTGFGFQALGSHNAINRSNMQNTAIGQCALQMGAGSDNTAVGFGSLRGNFTQEQELGIQNGNTAVGFGSLRAACGSYNIAIGHESDVFSSNANTSYNIAIGVKAYIVPESQSGTLVVNSTALGANSNCNGWSRSTVIGYNASCFANNYIILGTTEETVYVPGKLNVSSNISSSNASFTNVSFTTIANGSTTITNIGINTSNASFTNVSVTRLVIGGVLYSPAAAGVTGPNASFTNVSVIGNFSMPSTAYMNVSNASFTNVSVTTLVIGGVLYSPAAAGATGPTVNVSFNNISATSTISAQTFNSLSDFKLKENIIYLDKAFDLSKLKPCQFNFINSSVTKLGFIAHEVQEVVPLSVTGTKESIQSVDYSAIIAASILTIKTLIERVDYLENVLKKHNLN
jgi:hypothetical protein